LAVAATWRGWIFNSSGGRKFSDRHGEAFVHLQNGRQVMV
jgi:hypothetical protein